MEAIRVERINSVRTRYLESSPHWLKKLSSLRGTPSGGSYASGWEARNIARNEDIRWIREEDEEDHAQEVATAICDIRAGCS